MLGSRSRSRPRRGAGRDEPIVVPERHFVNGNRILPPWPEGHEVVDLALGCFWGAEKAFWGCLACTRRPSATRAASRRTRPTVSVHGANRAHRGRARRLRSETGADRDAAARVLESHDPTQGMRQETTSGRSTASAIYVHSPAQRRAAEARRVRRRAARGRLRPHLDRDPRRPALLLCRGVSPAVSGEEPRWLLWARRDRRVVPDRHGRRDGLSRVRRQGVSRLRIRTCGTPWSSKTEPSRRSRDARRSSPPAACAHRELCDSEPRHALG